MGARGGGDNLLELTKNIHGEIYEFRARFRTSEAPPTLTLLAGAIRSPIAVWCFADPCPPPSSMLGTPKNKIPVEKGAQGAGALADATCP